MPERKEEINARYMDNTNLAYDYDFSHFDEERMRRRKQENEDAKAHASRMRMSVMAVSRRGSVLGIVAVVTVLFLALNVTNYYSTECYDLASRVAQQKEILLDAQEENALLQSKLDTKVNISYIEEYATGRLGMQKVTAAQKSYVSVSTESLVEATEDNSGGFFGSVRRWFSDLMEYIGF